MTASEWIEESPGIYKHAGSMDQPTIPGAKIEVPCEVYSRVVGYLRPVDSWNKGQQQAFAERVPFVMPKFEAE